MKKEVLINPFYKELPFFVLLLLLSGAINTIAHFQLFGLGKALFIAMHHVVMVYVVIVLISILPKQTCKAVKCVLFLLLLVNFIVDSVCMLVFHTVYDMDILCIMLGSNPSEVQGFIQSYITAPICASVIGFILIIGILYRFLRRFHFVLGYKTSYFFFIIVILCSFFIGFTSMKNWKNISFGRISAIWLLEPSPDLHAYEHSLDLQSVSEHPNHVVMIIGESFPRSHSSLYGYEKLTNPSLAHFNLCVFNNVTSSAAATIEAFKGFMSTFSNKKNEDRQWYEYTALPSVLKQCGYTTSWVSNQNKTGFWDNIPSRFAELCDTLIWLRSMKEKMDKRVVYDENVILQLSSLPKDSLLFDFIHLAGSHEPFEHCFPPERVFFTPADYTAHIEEQRLIMAQLDNAILYNDSVVSEILRYYDGTETICLYFPDHGLDVFETREDYAGHAVKDSPSSIAIGTEIPFLIYMTPEFEQRYPQLSSRCHQFVNRPFNTENLIYTVMDIIGYKFADNMDVEKYSLIRQ